MIVVRFRGFLGNQMFQYALMTALEQSGRQVLADYSDELKKSGSPLQIKKVFDLDWEEAGDSLIRELDDSSRRLVPRLRRKIFGAKKTYVVEGREAIGRYHPEVFAMDHVLLDGYWQTERYFKQCAEIVRQTYSFSEIRLSSYQRELLCKIRDTNSVCVHIRRTDYLGEKAKKIYGEACGGAYYETAMALMRERVNDCRFFLFSDDIEYCRDRYRGGGMTIVRGENDFDMYLMSQCKHMILANSTFSWWAAWLNRNPSKLVIAPREWSTLNRDSEIHCDGWILLGGTNEKADLR